jgi:hypothetical protein
MHTLTSLFVTALITTTLAVEPVHFTGTITGGEFTNLLILHSERNDTYPSCTVFYTDYFECDAIARDTFPVIVTPSYQPTAGCLTLTVDDQVLIETCDQRVYLPIIP